MKSIQMKRYEFISLMEYMMIETNRIIMFSEIQRTRVSRI